MNIKDRTVIYGEVICVDGRDEPKVHIKQTTNKPIIQCDTDKKTIKELGCRLYERVGVAGLAERRISDMHIEKFTIKRVLPYKETPITEALAAISPMLSPHWKDMNDDEIVKEIRKMRDE